MPPTRKTDELENEIARLNERLARIRRAEEDCESDRKVFSFGRKDADWLRSIRAKNGVQHSRKTLVPA